MTSFKFLKTKYLRHGLKLLFWLGVGAAGSLALSSIVRSPYMLLLLGEIEAFERFIASRSSLERAFDACKGVDDETEWRACIELNRR